MPDAGDADAPSESAPGVASGAHTPARPAHAHPSSLDSVKHTLIALLIAFILTLSFRGFVMEGFIIPTGSMAPTLLGEHWRVRSPLGGHDWAINGRVGPRALGEGIEAADPISRRPLTLLRAERSAGDRILVLKWAYALRDPERWDAVVFKYPEQPRENFIKRLIGLPGEDVWLVDGDVFVRKGQRHEGTEAQRESGEGTERRSEEGVEAAEENAGSSEPDAGATGHPTDSDWRIVRKPDRVQRALWQPVWSSEEATNEGPLPAPARADADDSSAHEETRTPAASPWLGEGWEWTNGGRSLRHEGGEHARLTWDSARWPIVDWNPYNDPEAPTSRDARRYYPVNDVRVRFAVTPERDPLYMRVVIRSRDQVIEAVANRDPTFGLKGSGAGMAVTGEGTRHWERAAPGSGPPLWLFRPGRPTEVEVRVVDQSAELRIDGHTVARWIDLSSARERLARATGASGENLDALLGRGPGGAPLSPPPRGNPLADPSLFAPPEVEIDFRTGPITVHNLAVDRDIYYRPGVMEGDPRVPSRAAHPLHLASLSPDEFFVLGDNSGASKDGRLWDTVNPWVARTLDPEPGVVHRSLMLGKAFFVYFPAPHTVPIAGQDRPLVPDFGRMRFIR